jgi:hydroxymethylpyrimidine/phosphomethylpyrimidine kinase
VKRAGSTVVCSIGSIDPTAAAGILMDMRVCAHLGAPGVAVVASVTAQNDKRVTAIVPIPPKAIEKQLNAVFEQVTPHAMCIGLVPNAAAIDAIARFLRRHAPRIPVVLDPVMAASSGQRFLDRSAVRVLERITPLVTIMTPNLREAAALAGRRVTTLDQACDAASALADRGCAVLVTGGHLRGDACIDVLAQGDCVRRYVAKRIPGRMRGAGGILAAALAVELGRGVALARAVARARRVVRHAYRVARRLGSGTPQFMAR